MQNSGYPTFLSSRYSCRDENHDTIGNKTLRDAGQKSPCRESWQVAVSVCSKRCLLCLLEAKRQEKGWCLSSVERGSVRFEKADVPPLIFSSVERGSPEGVPPLIKKERWMRHVLLISRTEPRSTTTNETLLEKALPARNHRQENLQSSVLKNEINPKAIFLVCLPRRK